MSSINLATYVAKIEADSSGLNTGLDGADGLIKGKINGMSNWAKLAIGGMITGVVAGIGTTIKKSLDSFIEFENGMNSVYTLLPDMSEKAMSQMESQVKQLSKEMGVLPEETIPALYSALSASVPKDNVFEFLEVAQKGAIAGMTEAETVVDGLTTVLNSYHMEATDADKVSDILFTTIKKGKTSMEELSASMSNVTPVSSSLGVEFGDVGAALATMTAQGANTATSTTQLKQMFVELSKGGGETAKTFEKIAGKSFKEFIAEGGNVNEALQLMEGYAKDNGLEINDLFGSVQAGQAALMLTGDSAEMFAENIEEMGNSAGATDRAFEIMENGIGRSFEKIKVAMSIMLLNLGEKFAPAVKKMADFILDAMPTIERVVEKTFNIIGEIIKGLVKTIDWLVTNIKKFVTDNEESFNNVKETILSAFDSVIQTVKMFIDLFKQYWSQYGEYIINYIKIVWDTVKGVFQGAVDVIQGVIQFFISAFKGDWEGMGEAIKKIAGGMWKGLKTLWKAQIDIIANIMTAAIDTFKKIATNIIKAVWEAFKNIWESIKTWTKTSWESLGTLIEGFKTKFKQVAKTVFTFLWDGLKEIWQTLSNWVSTSFDNLKTAIVGFKDKYKQAAKTVFTFLWNGLKEIWQTLSSWVSNSFTNLVSAIIGFASRFFNAGKDLFSKMLDGYKNIWTTIIAWIKNIFPNLTSVITGFASRFFNAGKSLFSSVWDGMKNIWSSLSSWVSSKVSWLSDKLAFWRKGNKEVSSGGGGGGTRSGDTRTLSMPQYKVGTPFVPNDQLAFLHKGEAVIPAEYNPFNRNAPAPSMSGATNHNYHIDKLEFPNVRDAKEIEESIRNLSTFATQWANKQ